MGKISKAFSTIELCVLCGLCDKQLELSARLMIQDLF